MNIPPDQPPPLPSRAPAAPPHPGPDGRPRILAVADSDSYFKFACATLDALGPGWDRRVVLVRTPILPTPEQRSTAVAGTFLRDAPPTPVLPVRRIGQLAAGADVVLAAATGPVVQEVFRRTAARHLGHARHPLARLAAHLPGPPPSSSPDSRGGRTTALVSALPGVAYPATEKAMRFRALGDAFIAHSRAEARDFGSILAGLGSTQTILTSRLPFLDSAGVPVADPAPVRSVVFAAQAKFPVLRSDRERILLSLARTRSAHPGVEVIVKLRARDGEPQTHREEFPFDRLWDRLVADGRVRAGEVGFATGPMASVLRPGTLLATVSSTAVLEAVDRGLPAIVLGDFGLTRDLYNRVFAGSGLVGSLRDVEALGIRRPDAGWLLENYFHPPGAAPGADLRRLADLARSGGLATSVGGVREARRLAVRSRLRTALPAPALRLVRAVRR